MPLSVDINEIGKLIRKESQMGLPVPFYLKLRGNFVVTLRHFRLDILWYYLQLNSLIDIKIITLETIFSSWLALKMSHQFFSYSLRFLFTANSLIDIKIIALETIFICFSVNYLLFTCELTWVGSPQSLMKPTAASWSKLSADV